jgi:hypothetical protein
MVAGAGFEPATFGLQPESQRPILSAGGSRREQIDWACGAEPKGSLWVGLATAKRLHAEGATVASSARDLGRSATGRSRTGSASPRAGLDEAGSFTGDEAALVELGAEVAGIGAGDDRAWIVAGGEGSPDEVVQAELLGPGDLDDPR